jgi:membrane associated rhomboid family serine protease
MIGKWSTATGRAVRGQSAPVTYGLIGACCLIFLLSPASGLDHGYASEDELLTAQRLYFRRWGVVPVELLSGDPGAALSTVSALFVHGSWLHLLGNMLFLFVFGAMAEERMGHIGFALFYVGCGCLALVGYAVANADSSATLVGASGAISAVLGAFLYLFPRARVTSLLPFLFFLPLRFPAWVTLPFWAGLQWVAAGQQTRGPGVAYLAHVVGFALGFAYAWVRYMPPTRVKSPAPAPEGENQP